MRRTYFKERVCIVGIKSFYHKNTATFSYVVSDDETKHCAVIDAVLDFDMPSGKTSTTSIQKLIDYIQENEFTLEWILETHVHADHLSGAHELKNRLGGNIAISNHITEVQNFWSNLLNIDSHTDGRQFDKLFKDKEQFQIGQLEVKVMDTPGHTPACICYLINDSIFVGDTIFLPHLGTARADFPGGSAEVLYNSIQKILALPEETTIYVGHDYPKPNDKAQCQSTVGEQKAHNIMINSAIDKNAFVEKRKTRDASLDVPKLLFPAIQVNIQAGELMRDASGLAYLKIPLNKL